MSALIKQNCSLILASTSEIRKQMLGALALDFTAVKPEFDEENAKKLIGHLTPKDQTLFLARNKARQVSVNNPVALVIASDQICQLGKDILSKPTSKEQAIKQLLKLSGKIHYQNNAVCVYQNGCELFYHFDRAYLKMRLLTKKEVNDYVEFDLPLGCAGGYKFEKSGRHLFEEIKGNYDTILGMALQPLINFLHCKKLILLSQNTI